MALFSVYQVTVLLAFCYTCSCLNISESADDIFRLKRQVNIQVIVGDGNVQGITNNGASGGTISQQCISCICGGYSPCWISWAYWSDAGRPTVGSDPPYSNNAFTNCKNDARCARRTVESYVQKFQRDCNNDGRIDCSDYASIHTYGGFGGCVGKSKAC